MLDFLAPRKKTLILLSAFAIASVLGAPAAQGAGPGQPTVECSPSQSKTCDVTRNLGFNESVIGFDYKASPGYLARVTVYGSEPFSGKIHNKIGSDEYKNSGGSSVTIHYGLTDNQVDNGWKITKVELTQRHL
ncbi:hypothetical protein ACT3SZ_10020 [Corynebacterium sp. AOP40-9SA-29]|uniref:hypothetical protein n=1 Tax=Corynebacterium sp. AOP40-9SA-29 TaxID=3457677 RepID=UPI0040335A38